MTYSVVIPFYNEEASVEELIKEVEYVMEKLNTSYEIIAVNDGSTDSTGEKIEKMKNINPAVVPVHFDVNKGQTDSLKEGFREARGDVVISMDGDLQDDPREIPGMVEALERSGADVVCGWRKNRQDSMKKMSISRTANFFQRAILHMPVHDISCTFRVYKNKAVKALELKKKGLHRFLPYLLQRKGFKLAEKTVQHRSRKYGSSKYTMKKVPETIGLFVGLLAGKYQ